MSTVSKYYFCQFKTQHDTTISYILLWVIHIKCLSSLNTFISNDAIYYRAVNLLTVYQFTQAFIKMVYMHAGFMILWYCWYMTYFLSAFTFPSGKFVKKSVSEAFTHNTWYFMPTLEFSSFVSRPRKINYQEPNHGNKICTVYVACSYCSFCFT